MFAPEPADPQGSYSDGLRAILDQIRSLIPQADDEQSRMTLEKVTSLLQQDLADEEKEGQQMLTGKASPRLMSRAYGGG